MYVPPPAEHRMTVVQLLALCVVVTFTLSAMSIAYAAGRQQALQPVPPPSSSATR